MIRGLDRFREHFAGYNKSFVLIGGVACHEWLSAQGLQFRATKDIDIVLLIEAVDRAFVARLWDFIAAGRYQVRERASGDRELYRFPKPEDDTFPAILEIFSRKAESIQLGEGQEIVPLQIDGNSVSLSAILLDDAYYQMIVQEHNKDGTLPTVNPVALIPLKARAWLDLKKRKEQGEGVDAKDIVKHRTDVFRIAATLPGEPGTTLSPTVKEDLAIP